MTRNAFHYAQEPYLWESVYQLAAMERDPDQHRDLLIQAQTAMLQRAQALELGFGSDLECAALEAAADNVRKMKLKIQGDGSREVHLTSKSGTGKIRRK